MLNATYHLGTDRIVSPDATWERIKPLLLKCGITRCTSVTQLDNLGIPTYCSIRPDGQVLQVSNGKGLTDIAAKVSAAMEALELYHAENSLSERINRCSLNDLKEHKAEVLLPNQIIGCHDGYFGNRYQIDWSQGINLCTDAKVWAPASSIYFYCTPSLHNTSTNGLASGNHIVEASLHAIYELIERDAMSKTFIDGKLNLNKDSFAIDPLTIDSLELRSILEKTAIDNTKVILISLKSVIPVHTFWAIFLNSDTSVSGTSFNVGWGTHINKNIAASRALTEAAQSRLGFIHGARDDILKKPVSKTTNVKQSRAFDFFYKLQATVNWQSIENDPKFTMIDDLEVLMGKFLALLKLAGHNQVYQFDLTHPDLNIPVVKIIIPGLQFNQKLF